MIFIFENYPCFSIKNLKFFKNYDKLKTQVPNIEINTNDKIKHSALVQR